MRSGGENCRFPFAIMLYNTTYIWYNVENTKGEILWETDEMTKIHGTRGDC